MKIINNDNVCAIYATGDPFTNHVVGSVLKKISKLPLALDYRDAWIADPAVKRSGFRKIIEERLEKYCVKTADRVISVTEGVTEDFKTRYKCIHDKKKYLTISNGYDEQDAFGWEEFRESGMDYIDEKKLTIVHTGRLMGERTPKPFLKALTQTTKIKKKSLISIYQILNISITGIWLIYQHLI